MYISTILKFALFTSAALPTVLCAPIIPRGHVLSPEHQPNGNLEAYHHDGHLVEHATHMPPGSFATRAFVDIYPRNPVDKANIHLGPSAHKALHDGVDAKHHAAVEDYHKDIVKQHMESIKAILNTMVEIKSPYSIQKEKVTGAKTEGSFHVYHKDQPNQVAAPKVWEDKLAKAKVENDAKLGGRLAAQAHDDKQKQDAADRVAKIHQANAARVQKLKADADTERAKRVAEKKAIQDAAEI
ncbi:hypothetical protein D9619_001171 [Psilocybe cf. subviscida]|uniref:Uncharacterized protein n=1 Tax=Psilocybe cf. subviscida TaxID=2480587 RepID=A0A8H5F4C1_9AGAR|nr:hypothetical protein D9619_001171 [Psilocybe cf. subviscida]